MSLATITKISSEPGGVSPNLSDWERGYRTFRWAEARALLDGLPEGRGLNIAYEAVTRHARNGRRTIRELVESNMPYSDNEDLPRSVRTHLPEHAQDIFREAFNHALDEYGEEVRAFRVAWAAVKRQYEKSADGTWLPRATPSD